MEELREELWVGRSLGWVELRVERIYGWGVVQDGVELSGVGGKGRQSSVWGRVQD